MSIYFVVFIEILRGISILLIMLIGVAYLTLMERKVIASIQRRWGPNVVGLFGVLQPIADAVKLIGKESIYPFYANKGMYFYGPMNTLFLSLSLLVMLPLDYKHVLVDSNMGILYVSGVGSLSLYGIIFSGWASNSRYGFLGAVRTAAQMVSYEVSIGMFLVVLVTLTSSLNIIEIILAQKEIYYCIPLFFILGLYFTSLLAETNRAPFDLPEAEAELVAGYFVEHSSMGFASFFLGEYGSMIVMSALVTSLFLGGWNSGLFTFGIKIFLVLFIFIWIRAAFPRFRYDQLMRLGWKIILPLSFSFIMLVLGCVKWFISL